MLKISKDMMLLRESVDGLIQNVILKRKQELSLKGKFLFYIFKDIHTERQMAGGLKQGGVNSPI